MLQAELGEMGTVDRCGVQTHREDCSFYFIFLKGNEIVESLAVECDHTLSLQVDNCWCGVALSCIIFVLSGLGAAEQRGCKPVMNFLSCSVS